MMVALGMVMSLYFFGMLWIVLGMIRLPALISRKQEPNTGFSIIVPFRNEAKNLPALLKSLRNLDYPSEKLEVWFVNDASEDDSVAIIENFIDTYSEETETKKPLPWKILQNKRTSASPKKDAITLAVSQAKHAWILTTDADCQVPPKWLQRYNQLIQKQQHKMICGPVSYMKGNGLVKNYQILDGFSLQAATMGSFGFGGPLLCNGANLGYEKSTFQSLNGFEGNEHIASGDDIFLLQKMKQRHPKQIAFLKNNEATVLTNTEDSWQAVIAQRIRWASKTTRGGQWGAKLLGGTVLAGNIAFLICLILLFLDIENHRFYALLLFQKLMLDLLVITMAAHFFKRPFSILYFLLNTIIYPILTIWVVLHSFSGSYLWKGRKFEK